MSASLTIEEMPFAQFFGSLPEEAQRQLARRRGGVDEEIEIAAGPVIAALSGRRWSCPRRRSSAR